MNLANSTMKKNFVLIVDFCESPGVCKAPSSFCFNCCKVDNAFEVRSVRRSHSIGTLLVRMKPPITLAERVFLWDCGSSSASRCNRCKADNACLKSGLCVHGKVLEPCLFE